MDSEGDVGQYTSIALDGGAVPRPFISYYDVTNGDLKLAYRNMSTGVWTKMVIDSEGDVGRFSSIFVEEDGTAHIAYYDASHQDLKYAVWKNGEITTTTGFDADGEVGQFASIDLDAAGRPSIAYYDASNGDLKLATPVDVAPQTSYAPSAPTSLSATLEGANSVRLTWSPAAANESQPPTTGYSVYVASTEGGAERMITVGNVHPIPGRRPGVRHCLQLQDQRRQLGRRRARQRADAHHHWTEQRDAGPCGLDRPGPRGLGCRGHGLLAPPSQKMNRTSFKYWL